MQERRWSLAIQLLDTLDGHLPPTSLWYQVSSDGFDFWGVRAWISFACESKQGHPSLDLVDLATSACVWDAGFVVLLEDEFWTYD